MAEEETEEEYVPGSRSQMWIHEAHVQYLKGEYGDDVFKGKKAHEVIAMAFATRRDYRDSDVYEEAKEAHAAEVEAAKEAEAERKAEAKAEREAAAAEKAAAKKAAKGEAKKGGSKTAAKKGTSTRKRTTKKAAASEDTEDDPFD